MKTQINNKAQVFNKSKLTLAVLLATSCSVISSQSFAADLTAFSLDPQVTFIDTSSGNADPTMRIENKGGISAGSLALQDLVGANDHDVIRFTGAAGSTDNSESIAIGSDGNISLGNGMVTLDKNANSPNSMVVDSSGDISLADGSVFIDRSANNIGMGTATPLAELHIKDVSPNIMLEEVAPDNRWQLIAINSELSIGNTTTGFSDTFIIDGDAPNNTLVLEENGIGMGTNAPESALHVKRTDGTARIKVEDASATPDNTRIQLEMINNGTAQFSLKNTKISPTVDWRFQNFQGLFRINKAGTGVPEMTLDGLGNVSFLGSVSANNNAATFPDYVFEPDYKLMPLDKLQQFISKNKHLPNVISKSDVAANDNTVNMSALQYTLLEKIEELTLYTLAQEKTIKLQQQTISRVTKRSQLNEQAIAKNTQLQDRLASLEKLVTNLASGKGLLPDEGNKVVLNQ